MSNKKDALDKAMADIAGREKKKENMKFFLDQQLRIIERIDKRLAYYEQKKIDVELEKREALSKMENLLDLASTLKHELDNGYFVKPDNKYKIEITDIVAFMKWLKNNKRPDEVLDFFKNALKISNLKHFCNKEINKQRIEGIIEPEIDGVILGDVSFNKLTTGYKEKK
jgi:hypothetical protein